MDHFRPVDLPDTELSDTEIFLAKLLHHFMRVTYYNTHEITTTEEDDVADGLGPDKLQVATYHQSYFMTTVPKSWTIFCICKKRSSFSV